MIRRESLHINYNIFGNQRWNVKFDYFESNYLMMVVGGQDHVIQADIVFVIEGTAINGAYLNDLKSYYVIPTLEYFSHCPVEEREYIAESTNVQYGLVVYHAADCFPRPSCTCYGPYSSAVRVLSTIDKLESVGGRGESNGNVAEGLASALQCFEDMQQRREASVLPLLQRHCILICNSPPYLMAVAESPGFVGHNVEQLASVLSKRGIHLSILSPRKIPALFKLYEKAGGDLPASQTKNYAKDPRHLVLLKGYSLKERPVSPTVAAGVSLLSGHPGTCQMPAGPLGSVPTLSSPLTSIGSPIGVATAGAPPQAAAAAVAAAAAAAASSAVFRGGTQAPPSPQIIV